MSALILGIIALNAIGMWRGRYDFRADVFLESLKSLTTTGLCLDTAYAAHAGSFAMIKLTEYSSLDYRLSLFLKYIGYIFIGKKMGRSSNLSLVAFDAYPYFGGGGVLPYYAYFYLGIIGVALISLLVFKYCVCISKVVNINSDYKKCISVYIFVTVMAWYLYSPSPLIRGAMLFSILFFISNKIKLVK
jgi:hypothetical protein